MLFFCVYSFIKNRNEFIDIGFKSIQLNCLPFLVFCHSSQRLTVTGLSFKNCVQKINTESKKEVGNKIAQ